jgi:acyl carrier protein
MDIEKKFLEIVTDIFRVDAKELRSGTKFVDDLHAKSVDTIALIAATENTFGIRVPSQDARKNETIGQAIEYIKKKLSEKT